MVLITIMIQEESPGFAKVTSHQVDNEETDGELQIAKQIANAIIDTVNTTNSQNGKQH